MIAPGLAAPFHQHLFNVRLDMEVDGPDNEVYEVDAVPTGSPGSAENPWGNAFGTNVTLLQSELAAQRDVDASRSRSWRIANRSRQNAVGAPTAYKLLPGATPTLLADPTFQRGAACRLRVAQPLGHAIRCGGAARRRRLPQSASRPCRLADLDCPRSTDCRHRHRPVALLWRHPYPPTRRLAGHAGRVHRVHAASVRLLRPKPRTRRATFRRPLPWLSSVRPPTSPRSTTHLSRSTSRRCSPF